MTYTVIVKEQYIKLDLRPSHEGEEDCLELAEQNIRISNDIAPVNVKGMKFKALKSA